MRLGYDVRLLADLCVARREADRSLVLDRLALRAQHDHPTDSAGVGGVSG